MTTNKIFQIIPQAIKAIGAIGKDGTNTMQNYKFRSIDDMYNKIQPVLPTLGLFFIPNVLDSKEEIFENNKGTRSIRVKMKVEYSICADDGSLIKAIVEGEAVDTSDKATNKAFTAAFKYMLIQVFCIAIHDADDADKDSPEIPQQNENTKTQKLAPFKPLVNLPDYVVTHGRADVKGKKLSDLSYDQVNNIVTFWRGKGESLSGVLEITVKNAEEYLKTMKKTEVPKIDTSEKLPF